MKSPMTVQASLAQQQENIKNATVFSCTRLPDGEVDGTAASVYKVHSETPDVGSSEAQIGCRRRRACRCAPKMTKTPAARPTCQINYSYTTPPPTHPSPSFPPGDRCVTSAEIEAINVQTPAFRMDAEHRLFIAAAIGIAAIVFAGFARSYYLRGLFACPIAVAAAHFIAW